MSPDSQTQPTAPEPEVQEEAPLMLRRRTPEPLTLDDFWAAVDAPED